MKPAKFKYFKPNNLKEAFRLLEEYEDDCQILSGGQSLVPTMNMRLANPSHVIDINHITELDYIKNEGKFLKIGALTRQSSIERANVVKESCKLLFETVPHIGHVQTRNRGTVGGSIVHADPSAELPLTLLTLNGSVKISSSNEERIVNAEDFFITYLTTDILPTEILTEIHLPIDERRSGASFQEFVKRHGDFAIVAVSAYITVDESNQISKVRLGLGGVDAVPLLIEDVNELLKGEILSDSLIDEVCQIVESEVDTESDLHASSEYRVHLSKVLTRHALTIAYNKAKE